MGRRRKGKQSREKVETSVTGEDDISLNITDTNNGDTEMSDGTCDEASICMNEKVDVNISETSPANLPLLNDTVAASHINEDELSDDSFIEALVSSFEEIENSISQALARRVQEHNGAEKFLACDEQQLEDSGTQTILTSKDHQMDESAAEKILTCEEQQMDGSRTEKILTCEEQQMDGSRTEKILTCDEQQMDDSRAEKILTCEEQQVDDCRAEKILTCEEQQVDDCRAEKILTCEEQQMDDSRTEKILTCDEQVDACRAEKILTCEEQQVDDCRAERILTCDEQQMDACRAEEILTSKDTTFREYCIQASTHEHADRPDLSQFPVLHSKADNIPSFTEQSREVDQHSLPLDNLQIHNHFSLSSHSQTSTSKSDLMKTNPCTVDINQIPVSHIIEVSSNDVNLQSSDDGDNASISHCTLMKVTSNNADIQFDSDDDIPLSHLLSNALFTSKNDGYPVTSMELCSGTSTPEDISFNSDLLESSTCDQATLSSKPTLLSSFDNTTEGDTTGICKVKSLQDISDSCSQDEYESSGDEYRLPDSLSDSTDDSDTNMKELLKRKRQKTSKTNTNQVLSPVTSENTEKNFDTNDGDDGGPQIDDEDSDKQQPRMSRSRTRNPEKWKSNERK
ncbi:uncharacterized protein LOC124288902 [Haliotis rubra]|uniref:uncharacterized protein LOC124288902 n=1 Tax=Haliotis rubra TaxID=36100 RepID=UPI001EE530F0|nr:uncharacterized protein LOC124288902 [Haliotis rubra]